MCAINSKHFYSSGCVTTAHIVMSELMQHTFKAPFKQKKITPNEAWADGMKQNSGHSGMSAALTALIIAEYSPRGGEFKEWCMKNNVVWVDWKPIKKKKQKVRE